MTYFHATFYKEKKRNNAIEKSPNKLKSLTTLEMSLTSFNRASFAVSLRRWNDYVTWGNTIPLNAYVETISSISLD